jgi:hypothetical protein
LKKIILIFFCPLLFISCEKENNDILVGKWEFVKGFNLMTGNYIPVMQDQRIEEYTKSNLRILYDPGGNETARCNYNATNTNITIYGENLNGEKWSFNYDYCFVHDTLRIRHDGGFEYYDEFLIRIR